MTILKLIFNVSCRLIGCGNGINVPFLGPEDYSFYDILMADIIAAFLCHIPTFTLAWAVSLIFR